MMIDQTSSQGGVACPKDPSFQVRSTPIARQVIQAAMVTLLFLGRPAFAHAQEAPRESADTIDVVALDTIRIGARADDLIGIAGTSSEGRVGAADLRARPIAREGELLETVPGVIVTQHSGEGKANQFFVRGFNLDHGTDFRTQVEGMPVNLPTHGHGQGYTDLNFVIPELVELLDYRLGVYHAELGDFGSAGGAKIHLARTVDRPFIQLTLGEYGLGRIVSAGSSRIGSGTLLVGGEGRAYDGPWDLPQRVRKLNTMARYTREAGSTSLSLLALAYRNEWKATDQIPLRAVESGRIGRFGSIDPTDGGDSRRFSLSADWRRLRQNSLQEVQLFGIYSDLSLFSNFTYLLENSQEGDQFRQRDRRFVLGGNGKLLNEIDLAGARHALTTGLQHRTDLIPEVGLAVTTDRTVRSVVREDDVVETATGIFAEAESRWSRRFRTVLGIRGDVYTFNVTSDTPENSGSETAGILSPKGSLVFTPIAGTELYLSGGYGFHSNDARGTTIRAEPGTGTPVEPVDPLVRSQGMEVGLRVSPVAEFRSTLTGWLLNLDSELLFVGDAGTTEASGGSTRRGVTLATFYRPAPQLALDVDVSIARARIRDSAAGEDHIPGALERVLAAGVAWMPEAGVYGGARLRHFGEYPLIEDDAVRAGSTTLVNAEVGYRLPTGARFEIMALNLLDSAASDIEYFYTSRLAGEAAGGVEDIHFHPVEPRQLRATINWAF